jgi:hypothetical protein
MNLKQKMRVLMKLFLASALILVCPPDWHWEIVENRRWLERPWQEDNERYENECDKDSIVCHVIAHGENLNQLRTDDVKTHLTIVYRYSQRLFYKYAMYK